VSAGTAGARELPLAGNAGNLALHGCHHGYSSRRFVMPHDTTGRANPKPSSLGRLARATTLKSKYSTLLFCTAHHFDQIGADSPFRCRVLEQV
jgi:hypothetical protein